MQQSKCVYFHFSSCLHTDAPTHLEVLNGFGKPQETQLGPIWTWDQVSSSMVAVENVVKLFWRSTLPPLSVSTFRLRYDVSLRSAPDTIPVVGGPDALLASLPAIFKTSATKSGPLSEAAMSTFATALHVDGKSGTISDIRIPNLPDASASTLRSLLLMDQTQRGKPTRKAQLAFAASSGKLVQEATIFYNSASSQRVRRDLRIVNYVLEPGVDPRAAYIDLVYSFAVDSNSLTSSWRTKKTGSAWKISAVDDSTVLSHDGALRLTLRSNGTLQGPRITKFRGTHALHHRITLEPDTLAEGGAPGVSVAAELSLRALSHPVIAIATTAWDPDGKMFQPSSLMAHASPSFIKALKAAPEVTLTVVSVSAQHADLVLTKQKLQGVPDVFSADETAAFYFGMHNTVSNHSLISLRRGGRVTVRANFSSLSSGFAWQASFSPVIMRSLHLEGFSYFRLFSTGAVTILAVAFARHTRRAQQVRLVLFMYIAYIVFSELVGSIITS